MDKRIFTGFSSVLNALTKDKRKLAEGARSMAEGMGANREQFEKRRQEIEKEMKRGARLTDHKLSL